MPYDLLVVGVSVVLTLIAVGALVLHKGRRFWTRSPDPGLDVENKLRERTETEMRVHGIDFRDGALLVRCSGEYGVGSDGNSSTDLLQESIARWIAEHPDMAVGQIDVDYSEVEYSWGDGPLSSVFHFAAHGIRKFRLIASSQNREALESLVADYGYIEVVVKHNSSDEKMSVT